jgi:hypothetical protein
MHFGALKSRIEEYEETAPYFAGIVDVVVVRQKSGASYREGNQSLWTALTPLG